MILESLSKKYYANTPIDPKTLSSEDLKNYKIAMPFLIKFRSRKILIDDMIRLPIIENSSKALFASWQQDHADAPGDIEYVGTTAGAWIRSGKLNEGQRIAVGFLGALNNDVPAPVMKEREELKNMMRE